MLLPNLINEKSSQTRSCSSAQSVNELKSLDIVAALHLPPGHVSDGLHQGGSVSVETLGPVVSSPRLHRKRRGFTSVHPSLPSTTIKFIKEFYYFYLAKHKVFRSEYSAHSSSLDAVLRT